MPGMITIIRTVMHSPCASSECAPIPRKVGVHHAITSCQLSDQPRHVSWRRRDPLFV